MKRATLFFLAVTTASSCLFAQTTKNPFSKMGYKKPITYTSSKGEFEEFHDKTDVVEIGSVYFNTKTNKVVGYVNEEKENAEVASATSAMSVDPLCEKYYWISPYAFCLNNPVIYTDPTGLAPIYDPNGNLQGTDDNGLQGNAIIMNKDNFKQGMSNKDALGFDLGMDGLTDKDATKSFNTSFEGLKDRPDWDGYLTLDEANDWYRNGNEQPLFVALDKIDLSGIFSLGEKFVGQEKTFNLLTYNLSESSFVFGNIRLKRYPDHTVRAYNDNYDFKPHTPRWNPLNWPRNIEAAIGEKYAGQGHEYKINLYGSAKLKPILPFIK